MRNYIPSGYRSTMLENERYWEREEALIDSYTKMIELMETISGISALFAVVQWCLVFNYIYWWGAALATVMFLFVIAIALTVRGVAKLRLYRAIEHQKRRLLREEEGLL